MNKAQLRAEYKQKRVLLTPEVVFTLSQQVADQFFADQKIQHALAEPTAVLHTFLPIRRQHEVDTWPIIRRIWTEFPHVRVLSSVTDLATHMLTSFDLQPDTVLVENHLGIPEPATLPEPVWSLPTLVLVPLLAFDKQGHRVGYGGGYYDRFLTQTGPDCLKIGLSLFGPVPTIIDVESTDVTLEGCVGPERFYWLP
ncbi:5-formyltetrahydrofolate cyclo-ligase [Fibrella aquatilis]|uniref:5-formyltetrahydrofolate cyclo-ligase n=1 Tax=Fibrella aquatilis TaxID=2817059 RepID=A0A939JXE9_9BACT|nr:5-formyltetrahydrofolate cyclo-ligase [Fibrella aquatilis]MBO0932872.1 5-formyltetrahydrofolate cyclo-ligase [Fibrella aquatilis]